MLKETIGSPAKDLPKGHEGVDYHSFSSVNTWNTICGLQYQFNYLDRLPKERVADALVFGGGVNDALRSIEKDLLMGRKPNVALALEVLRSRLEKAYGRPDLPVVSTQGHTLESLFELGKRMTEHYVSVLPPDESPVDLPLRFTVPLFNKTGEILPRPLVGELDRWIRNAQGQIGIGDWKTSKGHWTKQQLEEDSQATAYLLAGEHILGHEPAFFRYDVLLKTKKPQMTPLYASRTEAHKRRFVKKVEKLDLAITSGSFAPNDKSFACPTCAFKDACKKWQD